MSKTPKVKLIPRNIAALRRGGTPALAPRLVAGNPVSTRLESGVGNCFPGLECDLRNLERRFFPFLEVDIADNRIGIAGVDLKGARAASQAGNLTADLALYTRLNRDIDAGRAWRVGQLTGVFGTLGQLTLDIAALQPPSTGQGRSPPDAWTAVRMLTEGREVVLHLRGPGNASMQLKGNRNRYLDDNGALADMFLPGELTQSLCSPWTHDFRDCGCYYWASNHPDIALPPLPTPATNEPRWNLAVPWERQDRSLGADPPAPASAADSTPVELRHMEINTTWQALNFVVGRREVVGPFVVRPIADDPLGSGAELERFLRYAAGVELTVAQQYLTAAYSLKLPDRLSQPLADDIRVSHAELMRIAIGEMRHLRAVNEVLRALLPAGAAFVPALRPASRLPGKAPGTFDPAGFTAATRQAIQNFIDIEAPSVSVDSVYARILATLQRDGPHAAEQSVRTIMAEGEDHFETFRAIQVWLSAHQEPDYLRAGAGTPPPDDADHLTLQTTYRQILERLYQGYTIGNPSGAPGINAARADMVGQLDAAAQRLAGRGFLVIFDPLTDPRFAPLDPP
jgi:hypothetical protein